MIKVGDRVKFISDTQSGRVVSMKGDIANVLVEDGFEIPAMVTDLVSVDEAEERRAVNSIGVGDARPGVGGDNRPKARRRSAPRREVPQYGRIQLTSDFDDDSDEDSSADEDSPLDMVRIRQQITDRRLEENRAEMQREAQRVAAEPSPLELSEYKIRLCFVPHQHTPQPEESDLDLWLVNDSSYELLYTICSVQERPADALRHVAHGTLVADSKEQLVKIPRGEIARGVRIRVQALLYKPLEFIGQQAISMEYTVQPVKFSKSQSYSSNDYFHERSIVAHVASSSDDRSEKILDPVEIIRALKQNGEVKPTQPQPKTSDPEVIDLHAEEIFDSIEGMPAGEILKGQLSRFEFVLDTALKSGRKGKIVFIHGVGSGKLKHEIKRLLASKYKKLSSQDASFAEYGYGAIMVFLK